MAATVRDHNKGYKMNHKNIFKSALFVFLMSALVAYATTEEKKGTIRSAEMVRLGGGVAERLVLRVDTTGNRIADTDLHFLDPFFDSTSKNLQAFVERGMVIMFDDEGFSTYDDGSRRVDGFNTISIDGDNMIFLFPAERERFKFAAREYDRQNAAD
jgi:hypothetical protein